MMLFVYAGVVQQDSGNYTCEVRGPQSIVLGHVTHFILVRGRPRVVLSRSVF